MNQTKDINQTHRVQIELPADRVATLDILAREAGMDTRKELFNNALALLQWAVKQAKLGRMIASIDEQTDRVTELQMPFLSAIGNNAQTRAEEKYQLK